MESLIHQKTRQNMRGFYPTKTHIPLFIFDGSFQMQAQQTATVFRGHLRQE